MAARVGLGDVEPKILKLAKHTTARLAPSSIVARIQSGDSMDDAHVNAARELRVAAHLAARGAPAVRPASADAGPHVENGCVITLWEFIDGRAAQTDADAVLAARALAEIHEALADLDADLPSFTCAVGTCEPILAGAPLAPRLEQCDRSFLRKLYENFRKELSRRELVSRALQGDTHLANVVITDEGAVWMDLEAVCLGPLEWDVVTLPSAARSEFGPIDPELARLLKDLRSLCVAVWCWADLDRSSEVADAAVHHLARLRARFD